MRRRIVIGLTTAAIAGVVILLGIPSPDTCARECAMHVCKSLMIARQLAVMHDEQTCVVFGRSGSRSTHAIYRAMKETNAFGQAWELCGLTNVLTDGCRLQFRQPILTTSKIVFGAGGSAESEEAEMILEVSEAETGSRAQIVLDCRTGTSTVMDEGIEQLDGAAQNQKRPKRRKFKIER